MKYEWKIITLAEYDKLIEERERDRRLGDFEVGNKKLLGYISPGKVTYYVTEHQANDYKQPCPSCGGLTLPGRCEWHGT